MPSLRGGGANEAIHTMFAGLPRRLRLLAMTINLGHIAKQLNSSLEARMLVKHVTSLSDADLITNDEIALTDVQRIELDNMIAQRLAGRPVSKIIGMREFYGRDFVVTDDVLDPRPDSEVLIEEVLLSLRRQGSVDGGPRFHGEGKIKILDLGTGSGCLILTLLAELPNAIGVATDISVKALDVARRNADQLGLNDRITFAESNWFENVQGTYDIIISNPPYIDSDVVPELAVDVREYDPIQALDGGIDGLDPYKVILPQIRNYLDKDGLVALEHGYDQHARIKRLMENAGLAEIRGVQDLGGHDRVLTAIHK